MNMCRQCRAGRHDECRDTIFSTIECFCNTCDGIMEARNRKTNGIGIKQSVPDSSITPGNHGRGEGGTCKECGCSLSHAVGSFERHQEWHELITTAIREQVEELVAEAVKQERSRAIDDVANTLMGYRHDVHDGHAHRWVDKGLSGESKLIVCEYCGTLAQSCDHSWKELDDGEYICIKCQKTDGREE